MNQHKDGLTKIEYLSAKFMEGFISHGWTDFETAAKNSIKAAKVLIKHLNVNNDEDR